MRKFGNVIRVYNIYLFIDSQKAYDSIHRATLWKWMEEVKIHKKIVK